MIRRIEITNFQSHKNTTLELDPHTNVIVGPSDSGKSAILRAINWVVNNRPSGDAFLSNGGSFVSVNLAMDDKTIERIKGPKDNAYIIDKQQTETVLKAFGTSVPEEVSKIINMADLNIQSQLDSPFLLSEGSSRAARYLNRIINLEAIDKTISEIGIRKRNAAAKKKTYENLLSDVKEKLKQFDGLEMLGQKITRMEKLEAEIAALNAKIGRAYDLIIAIQKVETELAKDWESLDDLQKAVLEVTQKQEEIQMMKRKLTEVISLHNAIVSANKALESTSKEFDDTWNSFYKLMPSKCPLCGALQEKQNNEKNEN